MTAVVTRVAILERKAGGAGDCFVCGGEPPLLVQYDDAPPVGEPCPGCGGSRLIVVAYVDEGQT